MIQIELLAELLKREQERAEVAEAEVRRLNTLIHGKMIPALINATQAVQVAAKRLKEQDDAA